MTTITALPTPPSRDDKANFASRGDAFMAALPTFVTQTNTVAGEVNTNATNAATSATNAANSATTASTQATNAATSATNAATSATTASTQATNAANSATSAANAPGTSATSTTSLAIGTGSKSLTITVGKSFALGQTVSIANTAAPANRMVGVITAFTSGTGALTVTVATGDAYGSGTYTAWTVALIGATGATGPTGSTAGAGGATASGSVTLTNASAGAQVITPTALGQYVTLPDATTMSEGAFCFNIENAGSYPYGVKDSAGTKLGWIYPGQSAVIGLADNSVAIGNWVTVPRLEPYALTLDSAGFVSNVVQQIDADRYLFLDYQSSNLIAVVYNKTTDQFGAVATVRAGAGAKHDVCAAAANQVLVCSTTTTAFEAVVLSISTLTVTVNTAATATLAGAISSHTLPNGPLRVAKTATGYACLYSRAPSNIGLRGLTISGTTVTIGAETAVSATLGSNGVDLYTTTGDVVAAMYTTSTPSITCKPYTVSGTTLTGGTAATVAPNSPYMGKNTACAALSSSTIFVMYPGNASNHVNTSVFSISGTTATVSNGTITSTVCGALDTAGVGRIRVVSASKVICGGTSWIMNVAVSAGVPTNSTVAVPAYGSIPPLLSDSKIVCVQDVTGAVGVVDVSAANPVATSYAYTVNELATPMDSNITPDAVAFNDVSGNWLATSSTDILSYRAGNINIGTSYLKLPVSYEEFPISPVNFSTTPPQTLFSFFGSSALFRSVSSARITRVEIA